MKFFIDTANLKDIAEAQALGILDTQDPKVMQTRIDARRDNTPEGAWPQARAAKLR